MPNLKKYEFSLFKIDVFKGSSINKASKPIKENINVTNEAMKKKAKKALQTSILGAILASETFQKSIKKLSKNDVEKDNQKSGLRTFQKKSARVPSSRIFCPPLPQTPSP